jgi:hypothetical protein
MLDGKRKSEFGFNFRRLTFDVKRAFILAFPVQRNAEKAPPVQRKTEKCCDHLAKSSLPELT